MQVYVVDVFRIEISRKTRIELLVNNLIVSISLFYYLTSLIIRRKPQKTYKK
jgi:hypothetical protein